MTMHKPAKLPGKPGPELKLLAIGKAELLRKGVFQDEDQYRDLMAQLCGGKRSAKELTVQQQRLLLNRLRQLGFEPLNKAPSGSQPRQRRQDMAPEARKARALWLFLHALGEVRDPSEAALAAYVKRIAGVDDLHWASGHALWQLIESLKKWAMRRLPTLVQTLYLELQNKVKADPAALETDVVRKALRSWHLMCRCARPVFDPHWTAWSALSLALGKPVPPELLADIPQSKAVSAEQP